MKVSSKKNKGRRLQTWIKGKLIEILDINPEDIESRSMGAKGEDIILSSSARKKFPFSVEAKNQERINLWRAMEQARQNSGRWIPLVIIKRNHSRPLAVIDAEQFFNLLRSKNDKIDIQ